MPWQDQSIPFSEKCVTDSYTICVPIAHNGVTERPRLSDKSKTKFHVDQVRVIDSNYWKKGATIDVLIPWRRIDYPAASLPLRQQILLVGSVPIRSKLLQPIADQSKEGDKIWIRVDGYTEYPAGQNEMLGLVWFLTSANSLAREKEPDWQFLTTLATTLKASHTAQVEFISDYLWTVLPPGVGRHSLAFGQPFDRFANLFSQAVTQHKPYDRALIYLALNKRHYYGSADLYIKNVRASITDPGAFPHGVPDTEFYEDPVNTNWLPKGFKHDVYPASDTAKLLARSGNPRVSSYLIRTFWPSPNVREQRSLRPLLDDPDAEVRYQLTLQLAKWNSDSEHIPTRQRIVEPDQRSERVEYPGLDKVVAYWKQKLGT